MTKRLQPIRLDAYKPLSEVVSETLRSAIQDGTLKPGERLMEIPLAEELGVNDPTRFIFTTDFKNINAKDVKTGDTLDINFADLPKYFDFLTVNGRRKGRI